MSDDQHLKEVEAKKFSKLTVEKKRRARINASLKEIKNLLLDTGKLDEFQYSRIEKAEILEAAVSYLRDKRYDTYQMLNLRRHGYNACAELILHRLHTVYSSESPVYQRVQKFLQERCSKGRLSSQLTNSANEISAFTTYQEPCCPTLPNNVPLSTENITTPLYTNHNLAIAPSNSAVIPARNYNIHPSFPTANPIWRPW